MKEVLAYLKEREEEFARHLLVARMLEERVDELVGEDDIQVEVRHVNTLKSGLLIHLYNIVEAVTTRTLTAVGENIVMERPGSWTEAILKEWVRAEVWSGEERLGETAVKRLAEVSSTLASGNSPNAFVVKGEPGSWSDKSIRKVAKRLGCNLNLPTRIRRAAYQKAYRNETTALEYLAKRRNAIAHGKSTFEDGANDLTLEEIEKLAKRVLPFLRAVSESYRSFLQDKAYLKKEEVGA